MGKQEWGVFRGKEGQSLGQLITSAEGPHLSCRNLESSCVFSHKGITVVLGEPFSMDLLSNNLTRNFSDEPSPIVTNYSVSERAPHFCPDRSLISPREFFVVLRGMMWPLFNCHVT